MSAFFAVLGQEKNFEPLIRNGKDTDRFPARHPTTRSHLSYQSALISAHDTQISGESVFDTWLPFSL